MALPQGRFSLLSLHLGKEESDGGIDTWAMDSYRRTTIILQKLAWLCNHQWCEELSKMLRYFYFTEVFPIFTFTSTPLHLRCKYFIHI